MSATPLTSSPVSSSADTPSDDGRTKVIQSREIFTAGGEEMTLISDTAFYVSEMTSTTDAETTFYVSSKEEGTPRQIGTLVACIVDCSHFDLEAQQLDWQRNLLQPERTLGSQQKVFQTLWTPECEVRETLSTKHTADLATGSLTHYVDLFQIDEDMAKGSGIPQRALLAHYFNVATVHGNMFSILRPCPMVRDPQIEVEEQATDDPEPDHVIIAKLIKSYAKTDHEVIVRGNEEDDEAITVVGRWLLQESMDDETETGTTQPATERTSQEFDWYPHSLDAAPATTHQPLYGHPPRRVKAIEVEQQSSQKHRKSAGRRRRIGS